jgi:hypothetical protein
MTHGEDAFEELGLLVPEHDAEDVVADEFFQALGDAAEKLFAVKNGRELATNLIEKQQSIGVLGVGSEQALRDRVGVTKERKGTVFELFRHGETIP